MNKRSILIVSISICIAAFLHFHEIKLPCFNSDEASFAYNAYSLLKTGADEYGKLLPARFLAFGENKLPVIIYGMIPSLAIFGLTQWAARLPFVLLGIGAPLFFFIFAKKMTEDERVAQIAAVLAGISPWIQIVTRHIHEAPVLMYLEGIILIGIYELQNRLSLKKLVWIAILNGLALFTYHSAKIFALFNLIAIALVYGKHHKPPSLKLLMQTLVILLIPVAIFIATEIATPNNRVSNLIFYQNKGFTLAIESKRAVHQNRLLHNKLTESLLVIGNNYASYFSPEFLSSKGDSNHRFGFPDISPITLVEYGMAIGGLVLLFMRSYRSRWLIGGFLLVAPVSAALTWQDRSITRSFSLILPLILLSSIGISSVFSLQTNKPFRTLLLIGLGSMLLFFNLNSWDTYFNHYLAMPQTSAAWQCGYEEVFAKLTPYRNSGKRLYVSRKLGQPYIFGLFYWRVNPAAYQKQAHLTAPDEYGFGQVEKFDQITFSLPNHKPEPHDVFVGTPEEMSGYGIMRSQSDPIVTNGTDVFWIYSQNMKL